MNRKQLAQKLVDAYTCGFNDARSIPGDEPITEKYRKGAQEMLKRLLPSARPGRSAMATKEII
jgi:hypothetical protein